MCWEVMWENWGITWGWEPTREQAEEAMARCIAEMEDSGAGPVFRERIWDWFQ